MTSSAVRSPFRSTTPTRTAPTLQIAVARHPAEIPSERIGSLVINPGGPGASGIADLPDELSVLTPELLDRFDIVSFDPRGVERSARSPAPPPRHLWHLSDPAPGLQGRPSTRSPPPRPADGPCSGATGRSPSSASGTAGPSSPIVGTVDAARDLDRIRAALGDPGLTFIGHSYGTLLGATYAELFPTHVRAMVLDGAIDPALSTVAYATDQADSLEVRAAVVPHLVHGRHRLRLAPGWGSHDLPAGPHPEPARPGPWPWPAAPRPGPAELYDALLAGLESQSSWPTLGRGPGRSRVGQRFSRGVHGRRLRSQGGPPTGPTRKRPSTASITRSTRNPSRYPALARQFGRSAPVFGPLLAWDLLGCATWPVPPTRDPAPASDPGAPPILVVGTTGDPVTPYSWAVSLAGQLTGGRLLTWQGHSHVAYYYSACVRAFVQAYLVAGTLPAAGDDLYRLTAVRTNAGTHRRPVATGGARLCECGRRRFNGRRPPEGGRGGETERHGTDDNTG